jgi:cyclopropane-fatty-acyl-phospholipid synthase
MTADRMRDQGARRLAAARALAGELGGGLDIDASVRLWDGSLVPLGRNVTSPLVIDIAGPGTISALLRRPTLDRLIRLHAEGRIDLKGGTLLDFAAVLPPAGARRRVRDIGRLRLARALLPFLTVPPDRLGRARSYAGDATGRGRGESENVDYIRFHYDLSNDFYALFLDLEMQYSCAYFTDWANGLDRAQADKLDMICRKLRLKAGDRLLDIGCGWGGLVCHAARRYGVTAHGVTLSREQLDHAQAKIDRLGLAGRVTVEIRDYAALDGSYDKIASIGMYEHVGVANIPAYFSTVRRLLAPGGLFLNHAIARRARRRRRRFGWRPEQRAILKYIFPGSELDDIGHTLQAMESHGFEVQDVENWRYHYARTTRAWCERLAARRAEAEALVGPEVVRLWLAYLAGVSLGFARGPLRIYQTLASAQARGPSPLPPTRADLYR